MLSSSCSQNPLHSPFATLARSLARRHRLRRSPPPRLRVVAVSSEEQIRATIEKFATDDTVASAQCLVLSSSAAAIYSQPIALRSRFIAVAGHVALRTLQGPILFTRFGPQWGVKWMRFSWLQIVASTLGGWIAASLFWHSRASRAVACAAHADSLDERYGNKSARVRRMPNSMLQTMVDNLKAEVYEARLRLMSRATHREEELHEGDIRGSFAERA